MLEIDQHNGAVPDKRVLKRVARDGECKVDVLGNYSNRIRTRSGIIFSGLKHFFHNGRSDRG